LVWQANYRFCPPVFYLRSSACFISGMPHLGYAG
jgi:hypothetical protein